MQPDPIVEEIHKIREEISKEAGDDIREIAKAAKARQAQSGRKSVRLPPKKAKALPRAS